MDKYNNTFEERNKKNKYDMADEAMQNYFKKEGLVEKKDWLKLGTEPKDTPDMKMMCKDLLILLMPDYNFVMNNKHYLPKMNFHLKGRDLMKLID